MVPELTCVSRGIRWIDDIEGTDLAIAGGKGASLGELTSAGMPVPAGFIVTADSYREFIEANGIDDELVELTNVDTDDASELSEAAARAQERVMAGTFPDALREEIHEAYGELRDGEETYVAVRSSATAEDLPDASFAGQQETFLNVQGEALTDRIRECWASLFTPRAIYYRAEQGFDTAIVDIAVVVQEMVDAEISGVLFTSHPSTGDDQMIIEAAWGLGEAVVSGRVSPDTYVVDANTGEELDVSIGDKKVKIVRNDAGDTEELPVADGQRNERVLDADDLARLAELGHTVADHYGSPQDVEWAIFEDDLYVLQSRPITTLSGGEIDADAQESNGSGGETPLLTGIGASPGRASGPVRVVHKIDQLDKVNPGDVLVTEMTTPDMVPAMKRASAIVTDEGGMTSHASIVSRELGVPAVVGTSSATAVLEDGQLVTVDGEMGRVFPGSRADREQPDEPADQPLAPQQTKPMTATSVLVNISIPEAAERAARTGADGVGLLRIEHLVLSMGKTPSKVIADDGPKAYTDALVDGIRTVADAFYPRPVRVRTLDAPTDEFRQMVGGDEEPIEHNPMLGYRGIRRSLDRTDAFDAELDAFRRLFDMGYDNIELMLPLITDANEITRAADRIEAIGIDLDRRTWGVMIETPASALRAQDIVESGIDFLSFGTNDLTQYTLAVDRNNEHVADRFDELHPAVLTLIEGTIETARANDVETSICGQAGSNPRMIEYLVTHGIGSISANVDAVRTVQEEVKRVEQRLLLDAVR